MAVYSCCVGTCGRYVWGLVHSQRSADIRRGLDLAEQLLKSQELDGQDHKDLVYLHAVAQYRLGNVLDARRQLDELLAVSPHSRQVRFHDQVPLGHDGGQCPEQCMRNAEDVAGLPSN